MTAPAAGEQPIDIAPERPSDAWRRSYGTHWKIDLAVMAIVVFLFGAVRPLADPDLPMHLTIGEWIVRHGRVPFTEPFSWTATGQPYFAYSWLQQTLYYWLFSTFGSVGLRAVQGFLVLGSAAACVLLAQTAGWRPGVAVILAGLNVIIIAFFVALLRPQSILFITMPVIWAMMLRVATGRGAWGSVVVLFLASAVTANSHLFFVLTLAPAILLWVHRRLRAPLSLAAVGAVVAGWLASPYASSWIAVYRFNFGSHILMRPPSAITELQPGYVVALTPPGPLLALVLGMLTVPWIVSRAPLADRERWFAALYWIVGAVLFGFAVRLFVVWWVLAIVPVGWTLARVTGDTTDAPPRLGFRILGVVACAVIVASELFRTRELIALEGSTSNRVLPTYGARVVEPLARWLVANTRPDAGGRILTGFTFGSYLSWRLPRYSTSMDSRGLQPDSVAGAEAIVTAAERDLPIGPWQRADVAILRVNYRAAAVLDTAAGWRRLRTVPGDPIPLDSVALWVDLAWWRRNARDGAVADSTAATPPGAGTLEGTPEVASARSIVPGGAAARPDSDASGSSGRRADTSSSRSRTPTP